MEPEQTANSKVVCNTLYQAGFLLLEVVSPSLEDIQYPINNSLTMNLWEEDDLVDR